jgi:hypothetical protein
MRIVAFVVPAVCVAALLWGLIRHSSQDRWGAGLVATAVSVYLGRFLYLRSKNLDARFFYLRVSSSDPEGNLLVDLALFAASLWFLWLILGKGFPGL